MKVFIAEDNPLHMAGTISYLKDMGDLLKDKNGGCHIVGKAKDGSTAYQSILELNKDANTRPDIALLDINMPGMSGLEVAEELKRTGVNVKVIILTGYYGPGHMIAADKLKVKGFLRKEAPFDEFVKALCTVYEGQIYMDSALIEQKDLIDSKPEFKTLTENERTALILFMRGYSIKEAAEEMHKSPRAVQGYRSSLLGRLKSNDPDADSKEKTKLKSGDTKEKTKLKSDDTKEKPNMIKVFKWAKSLGFISEKDIYE